MMDFTNEDLFDAIDRAVNGLLDQVRITSPPVDALEILRGAFGYRIDYDEPHDAPPRYGDPPKRRAGPNELILHPDASEESQQTLAARTIAKKLIPAILTRLGVVPGTENKSAQSSLVGLVTARLLLPSRWFVGDARRAAFDLTELKDRYRASWELLAWRLLDADDEPSVVAILDDGSVSARRGNRFSVSRTLTEAEQRAVALAQETDDPSTVRHEGWTATAWPTTGVPFRRIVVRAVPDQL